jgi:hypothetical protein
LEGKEEDDDDDEGAAKDDDDDDGATAAGAAMLTRADARASTAPARRHGRACTPAGLARARIGLGRVALFLLACSSPSRRTPPALSKRIETAD